MRLSYVSVACAGTDDAEIARIVASALRHNQQNHVTGVLLAYGGRFLQLIEGQASAVERTFARIERDPRHRNVVVIDREFASVRLFEHWAMRHVKIDQGHDRAVTGFLDELATEPDAAHAQTALSLLERLSSETTPSV